jgi:uncharacterized protein YidB (DUF937 family)
MRLFFMAQIVFPIFCISLYINYASTALASTLLYMGHTMSILDGIIGGIVSAGVSTLVSKVIEQQGGVSGLVSKFEQNGLGSIVQSWVATGANQAINPSQIQQALGGNVLQELAAKTGLSADDLSAKLAEILPEAIDKLTPNGQVAEAA